MSYIEAKEKYAKIGVDTESVLEKLEKIKISLHCWQGDDVGGFETAGDLTGGIQVTGHYPGKAKNAEELRADLSKVLTLIPGKHKVNVHAIYGDVAGVPRDEIKPEHFKSWVDWAKKEGVGLDFNPTFFSHPLSEDGFTLSSSNEETRAFWVRHGKACRKIGEYFGRELGITCVTNFWIPDGYKDSPIDRFSPRARLQKSLDEIFEEKIDPKYNVDAVEGKVFGIGSECYVTGSHEFYMCYAVKNNKLLTIDSGHYHPTETIADKISSAYNFLDNVLLHVSRPERWDSDHVVKFNDMLIDIMQELVRNDFVNKTYIALDFFDGSINRIAAWAIGTRNAIKALMFAMLEPTDTLKSAEADGDYTTRLALTEELKSFPYGEVWEEYCRRCKVTSDYSWISDAKDYEQKVLLKR